MKYIFAIILSLFVAQFLYAEADDVDLKYDKVSVGYIPTRGLAFNGEPYKIFEARTLAKHKNADIAHFFMVLDHLASEGVTDNATQLHEPAQYIEAIFQGKRVRLFYMGESNLEQFKHYERQWTLLHEKIYSYLNDGISSK
ncbi:MAG: hypothetical protein GXP17_08495 [Gammaproteobacteria bacterium]|nr:hypothetical protein [Gammaproteobacteria bacterium]